MDGYKHYIRIDTNNNVIHGFSDAFEQPINGDIILDGEFGRHFMIQLINERGQYIYKLLSGVITKRSDGDLESEWMNRPPTPPSLEEQVTAMQEVINTLLLGGL